MVTFGYAKGYQISDTGTLNIRVRIPAIHGPCSQTEYRGAPIHNYVRDEDLPYIPSLVLPQLPKDGQVVAITSLDDSNNQFLVIGLTGSQYSPNNK